MNNKFVIFWYTVSKTSYEDFYFKLYTKIFRKLRGDHYHKSFPIIKYLSYLLEALNIDTGEIDIQNLEDQRGLLQNSYTYINRNKKEFKFINIFSKYYNEDLRNIYDPPLVIFYEGKIELFNQNCVSVVGSRKAQRPYLIKTFHLCKYLKEKNNVVVSGGAKGIDKSAHMGAYPKTICVLGTPIDVSYPKGNQELFKRLKKRALVISEFIMGTYIKKFHFIKRNRIISGMSKTIIIPYCTKDSGSLITLEYGLEENKEIIISKKVEENLEETYLKLSDVKKLF